MKQSGLSCVLRDGMVGNSSVPTKVSKNISTDLQEAESDGKETKGAQKSCKVEKNLMHMFFNFPATVVHNPCSAQGFNFQKCQELS